MNLALTSCLLVGTWSLADTAAQTWAALSGATTNAGNSFSAGTVALADNDGGSTAMFAFTDQRPGIVDTSCIHVGYSGSLPATVRLHAAVTGALAPYLHVTVTRGSDPSPAFDSCTSFTADAIDYTGQGSGVLWSGRLSAFPAGYDSGVADPAVPWNSGTSATYRFAVTIADDDAAQGLDSTAAFTWEARS